MSVKQSAISPAIQNSQMEAGAGKSLDKEEVFKELFSDSAYKSFESKLPYLVEHIKDFKVLNSDSDNGYAVGAFIVQLSDTDPDQSLMVPVILENNNLQQILFMYHNKMDLFLPVTEEWVEEILKKTDEESGEVVKPKLENLYSNNVVNSGGSPGTQGFYGITDFLNKTGSVSVDIPDVISKLTAEHKSELHNLLSENTKVAQQLFKRHGFENIKEAFKIYETKEAADDERDIVIATDATPIDVIKKDFGKDQVVMDDIIEKGFSVKDNRKTDNKLVVFTEHVNNLENPGESGTYELYLSTGKVHPALIIQDPIKIECGMGGMAQPCNVPSDSYKTYQVIAKNQALVLFPDGKYCIKRNDDIMASPVIAESLSGSKIYDYVFGDKTTEIPVNKPFIFVKKVGKGFKATAPLKVRSKMTEDGDIKCITNWGNHSIIYSDKYKGDNIYVSGATKGSRHTIIVPTSFKAIPVEEEEIPDNIILGSMKTILTLMSSRLMERGGKPITIVKDDQEMYGIESNKPVRRQDAVLKIARENNVNAKDVDSLFTDMSKVGSRLFSAFVLPKEHTINSIVNEEVKTASVKEAQGMDPAMLAQMAQMAQMGGGAPMAAPMGQGMGQGMGQEQMMPGMQGMQGMQGIPQGPMNAGADAGNTLGSGDLFDVSALMSLSYVSKIDEIFPKYLPKLIGALDSLARIVLNLWMNARDIQEDIGVTDYTNLELKLKTLFNNLGDLLINLNKKMDIFAESQ